MFGRILEFVGRYCVVLKYAERSVVIDPLELPINDENIERHIFDRVTSVSFGMKTPCWFDQYRRLINLSAFAATVLCIFSELIKR